MTPKKNVSNTKEESSNESSEEDEKSKEEVSEEEQEMEWRELTRPEKKMLGTWRFVSYSSQELISPSLLLQRLGDPHDGFPGGRRLQRTLQRLQHGHR